MDTVYWLQMIDWQTKFLSMVLNFTKDPGRKTLRQKLAEALMAAYALQAPYLNRKKARLDAKPRW